MWLGALRRGRRWTFWERHFGDRIGILEGGDQPFAGLLLQRVGLDTLLRGWSASRAFRTGHGPANVRDCDFGSEELHIDVAVLDGEHAFLENEGVGVGEFPLDLGAAFP